ncbi:hypothetical protein D2N39_13990 [Gemmobacter lutimaris]|uniref:Uncharacterized protein n=1 Tax=Gemmobacter lutimaris TaxID=2306023 RepID=A0A398BTZ9_9RHOB|nr:hypothetical protein D2N39_13990 [Gemmobacter lutimaris]
MIGPARTDDILDFSPQIGRGGTIGFKTVIKCNRNSRCSPEYERVRAVTSQKHLVGGTREERVIPGLAVDLPQNAPATPAIIPIVSATQSHSAVDGPAIDDLIVSIGILVQINCKAACRDRDFAAVRDRHPPIPRFGTFNRIDSCRNGAGVYNLCATRQ